MKLLRRFVIRLSNFASQRSANQRLQDLARKLFGGAVALALGNEVRQRGVLRRGQGRAGRRAELEAAWLKHFEFREQGLAEAGGAPAARAFELPDRVGEASLAVGEPGGEPGTGTVVLRQPRERGARHSRLVNGEAERGKPGRRRFKRGQRATAVSRAPQRGGPAVRPGEPDQAAQRCGQRPPGERHRAHRVVGHVPQHHGCGEYDGARRRLYGHEGRWYRQLAVDHGGP